MEAISEELGLLNRQERDEWELGMESIGYSFKTCSGMRLMKCNLGNSNGM